MCEARPHFIHSHGHSTVWGTAWDWKLQTLLFQGHHISSACIPLSGHPSLAEATEKEGQLAPDNKAVTREPVAYRPGEVCFSEQLAIRHMELYGHRDAGTAEDVPETPLKGRDLTQVWRRWNSFRLT